MSRADSSSSTPAAVDQERVAALFRQLRSRVDKAREIYEDFTAKSNRTPFNSEQRRIVAEYTGWVEDLEELRLGRLPPPRTNTATAATAPLSPRVGSGGGFADTKAVVPGMGAVVSKSKKQKKRDRAATQDDNSNSDNGDDDANAVGVEARNGGGAHVVANAPSGNYGHARPAPASKDKNKKGGGGDNSATVPPPPQQQHHRDTKGDTEEESAGEASDEANTDNANNIDVATEADLLATLRAIRSRAVQAELITAYADRHAARPSPLLALAAADRQLASAEGLKQKIISGAVTHPSAAQLAVMEGLPGLRAARKEDQQLRERLRRAVDDMRQEVGGEDEADDEEEVVEVVEEEASQPPATTTTTPAPPLCAGGQGGSGAHGPCRPSRTAQGPQGTTTTTRAKVGEVASEEGSSCQRRRLRQGCRRC